MNRLDPTTLQGPIDVLISSLKGHKDFAIATQAAYAKQSLLRLAEGENRLKAHLKRAFHAGKGLFNVAIAVVDKELGPLLDAYKDFKEATQKGPEVQEEWHDQLRYMQWLFAGRNLRGFERFFRESVITQPNPNLTRGLFLSIKEMVSKDPEIEIKEAGISFLSNMFIYEQVWGDQIQESVVKQLLSWAQSTDRKLKIKAKNALYKLKSIENPTQSQNQWLKLPELQDLSSLAIVKAKRRLMSFLGTGLFEEAIRPEEYDLLIDIKEEQQSREKSSKPWLSKQILTQFKLISSASVGTMSNTATMSITGSIANSWPKFMLICKENALSMIRNRVVLI